MPYEIALGGTGSVTAAGARIKLGLGPESSPTFTNVTLTGDLSVAGLSTLSSLTVTGAFALTGDDVQVSEGGTGVSTITGIITGNGTAAFTGRTLTGTANEVDIAAGDGVSGNPTVGLSATIGAAKAFRRGNVLDTVSQSGGTPTGGLIERGTNANGEYVRFADGTQICTHRVNLGSRISFGSGTYADPYRSSVFTPWTFPTAFVAAPALSGIIDVNNASGVVRAGSLAAQTVSATAATNIQAVMASSFATDVTVFASLIAIGRWF